MSGGDVGGGEMSASGSGNGGDVGGGEMRAGGSGNGGMGGGAAVPAIGELSPGQVVATATYPVQRVNLVMYAGASGDFNPIHWNERIATAVGLPNVIAHGMFTMAQAGRALTDWVGDPGRVEYYSVRFTRPVVVPDDDTGARLDVTVTVAEVRDDGRVRLDLTATSGDDAVLGKAAAVVRLT